MQKHQGILNTYFINILGSSLYIYFINFDFMSSTSVKEFFLPSCESWNFFYLSISSSEKKKSPNYLAFLAFSICILLPKFHKALEITFTSNTLHRIPLYCVRVLFIHQILAHSTWNVHYWVSPSFQNIRSKRKNLLFKVQMFVCFQQDTSHYLDGFCSLPGMFASTGNEKNIMLQWIKMVTKIEGDVEAFQRQ